MLSCVTLVVSYLFFLSGQTFLLLAVGQILLAMSLAFRSGTDTSLLYESLSALGRANEYGDREAKAGQYGFLATAIAALVGGITGSFDLSLPYWLSLASACAMMFVVFRFTEPGLQAEFLTQASATKHQTARIGEDPTEPAGVTQGFLDQLGECCLLYTSPSPRDS